MCGLAGIVAARGIDPALLPAMADALHHRGPDCEGYALVTRDGAVAPAPRAALEGRGAGPRRSASPIGA